MKQIIYIMMFLLLLNSVVADDGELRIICGGDGELKILCIGGDVGDVPNVLTVAEYILAIIILFLSVIYILFYYSMKLKKDFVSPLRVFFFGSAIFLLVNLIWVAYTFAQEFGASASALSLMNTAYFMFVTIGLIIVFSIFILTAIKGFNQNKNIKN